MLKLETELPPLFAVKSQKFPLAKPVERIANATGVGPVETVPPFAEMAVSCPVT